MHLKIDDDQSEEEAAWFPYAPPTGNEMYSMSIVGTDARLYFPSENGENPSVTGCVRTNGGSCAKTSDTTKRYFETEHGSELEMTPGALNIKGGSKEPLNISIDDEIGITITSPKKLTLPAAAVATLGIGAAIVGAVAVACIGAICSSSVVAAAAGVQSAMGALAISSCAVVCGAVLWDFSEKDDTNNYSWEDADKYINSRLLGICVGNKIYYNHEISNLPREITYKKNGYTYTYMLDEHKQYFMGLEMTSGTDITLKDGRVISDKKYEYKLVYTDEPKLLIGMIQVSPGKTSVAGKVKGGSGKGYNVKEGTGNSKWTPKIPEGGTTIGGREYSEHVLERMAPKTSEIRAELTTKATKLARKKGLQPQTKEYNDFINKYVEPRGITPTVIEDAINNTKAVPGNTEGTFVHENANVKVIVNQNGKVVTIIPR